MQVPLNRYVTTCLMIYHLPKTSTSHKSLYAYAEKKLGYVTVYDVTSINRTVYDLVL